MSKNVKRSKGKLQRYTGTIILLLLSAGCGILMAYIDIAYGIERSSDESIVSIISFFLMLLAAMFIQIIIHESGHLVFGLLSGYRFSSFRIMSFMWIKEDGRIKLKRLSLAGTGGQCLMVPPDPVDGKIPVVLYNLGGPLMNIITGCIFLAIGLAASYIPVFSPLVWLLALTGLLSAIINGVPVRMGTVDNDGYNAFSLVRNPDALRSFWIQMKVNEQTSKGIRLKDMPDEWFIVPSDEKMKNSMISAMGVFACNRLMDAHRLEEADELMAHLLEIDSGMVGLYRNLMICDQICVKLIMGHSRAAVDAMLTKEQRKFMKSMKQFPSVVRTEYIYTLLAEKDVLKAKDIERQFEKCAQTYPYPNEIQSERELMELAACP